MSTYDERLTIAINNIQRRINYLETALKTSPGDHAFQKELDASRKQMDACQQQLNKLTQNSPNRIMKD